MAASKTTRWIGPHEYLAVGQIGFLIEKSNPFQGWQRFHLTDTPAYTNRSCEPRLTGWCGSYNDVSTYGHGMARVEKVAKNGRALVRDLSGDELAAALEQYGYPDIQ